eukprot:TCONS_00072153-protein
MSTSNLFHEIMQCSAVWYHPWLREPAAEINRIRLLATQYTSERMVTYSNLMGMEMLANDLQKPKPSLSVKTEKNMNEADEKLATLNYVSDLKTKTKSKMLKEYEQKMGKPGNKRPLSRIPLWYFLHEILDVERCNDMIGWECEPELIFTIKKPKELACLWGQIKSRENMTYAKLARGIRYYYGKGVIEKFNGKRFCYQFIVSKKTKAVLSKRKNIPQEIISTKSRHDRKRKSPLPDTYKNDSKKSWENRSQDGFTNTSVKDWTSDDDDIISDSDLSSLDQCISDIFTDPKFATFFPDVSLENKVFPTSVSTTKLDSDMFIMTRQPSELGIFPTLDDMSQFISTSGPTETLTDCLQQKEDLVDLSNLQDSQLFDIYDQDNSFDGYQPKQYRDHQEVQWDRKKSKSESEAFFQDFFNQNTSSLQRSSATVRSLPDFSIIDNNVSTLKPEDQYGFFTNMLLDQEDTHTQSRSSSLNDYFNF